MSPEARRSQILDAARELMTSSTPFEVSTADVAAAAGVTRALVHHYFRGIDELRQAVALDIVRSVPGALHSGAATSVAERVRRNTGAFLDLLWNLWLATLANAGEDGTDRAPQRELRDGLMNQMLTNNADLIDDTPWARACLTGYLGFAHAICLQWIDGEIERAAAEHALVETFLHMLLVTIPNGPRAPGAG